MMTTDKISIRQSDAGDHMELTATYNVRRVLRVSKSAIEACDDALPDAKRYLRRALHYDLYGAIQEAFYPLAREVQYSSVYHHNGAAEQLVDKIAKLLEPEPEPQKEEAAA